MKNGVLTLIAAVGLLIGTSLMGLAQEIGGASQDSGSDQRAKVVVLAGCLERGTGADEYSLHQVGTATSWELKSDSVNLDGHMDQMVVVTAVKIDDPHAPLKVIALHMDTNSCNSW